MAFLTGHLGRLVSSMNLTRKILLPLLDPTHVLPCRKLVAALLPQYQAKW